MVPPLREKVVFRPFVWSVGWFVACFGVIVNGSSQFCFCSRSFKCLKSRELSFVSLKPRSALAQGHTDAYSEFTVVAGPLKRPSVIFQVSAWLGDSEKNREVIVQNVHSSDRCVVVFTRNM